MRVIIFRMRETPHRCNMYIPYNWKKKKKLFFLYPFLAYDFAKCNVILHGYYILRGVPPISCICITNIYNQYTSLRFIFTYCDSVLYRKSLLFLKWITIHLSYFLLSTSLSNRSLKSRNMWNESRN